MNQMVKIAEIARIADEVAYDPETGLFTSKVTKRGWPAGRAVGGKDAKGYIVIKSQYFVVKAHRLAWFICHGELPDLIDHIDGDPANNRISNLRPADKRINNLNRWTPRSDNRGSGLIGVCQVRGSNKWAARITKHGKRHHLGCFDTPEAAHARYLEVKREHLKEAVNAD